MATRRDDEGNIRVDFVWGNMPLQPDDDRSTPLDPALDNHSIATTGYANFPDFIANYEGDDDTAFEVVVPDFIRMTLADAQALANEKELNLNAVAHNLTINYVESTGTTVRVWAYDTEYNNWSNTHGDAYLINLRAKDELFIGNVTLDDGSNTVVDFGTVTVTKVNLDGTDSWFEFKVATAPGTPYDYAATGGAYAGPNLVNIVTTQRTNVAGGYIVDEGRLIGVRYFQQD